MSKPGEKYFEGSSNIEVENITKEDTLHIQTFLQADLEPENIKLLEAESSKNTLNLSEKAKLDNETEVSLLQIVTSQATGNKPVTFQITDPNMGSDESKQVNRNDPKYIISEDPQFLRQRERVVESTTTGNCIPWSDHVYYKLFLDIEGRNARLMVLKCEISYIDVFSDEEHSLYKSRFIGGKADGVAELLSFDLMKSDWEKKIPQSQAIELNMDIVMSSSPIHQCSETLLNLLQLEKSYLKHQHFDGQLNVAIRFAHPYAWDVKDDIIRERVHNGLCNLFREGVDLEVLSVDSILEEMRLDGILTSDDDKINHFIAKRNTWKGNFLKRASHHRNASEIEAKSSAINYSCDSGSEVRASTSRANETFDAISDFYHVGLHGALWDIIQDTKRVRGVLEETV